jgi:hypothetical protein
MDKWRNPGKRGEFRGFSISRVFAEGRHPIPGTGISIPPPHTTGAQVRV